MVSRISVVTISFYLFLTVVVKRHVKVKMRIIVLLLSYVVMFAGAQDCKVAGKKCVDHEQCCGGCCFYGECIDTYRSCLSSMDVCDDHVCLGEEECIVYTPPQCPGCEPLPLCRMPETYLEYKR